MFTMPCTSLMSSLSWTFAFTLSMVSLAFDIERGCLAGQRLDEDLHATTQCVLLGFGGDGLRRLREGLRSCRWVSPTPWLPAFGTPSVFWQVSWSFRPLHVLHVERLGNLGTLIA